MTNLQQTNPDDVTRRILASMITIGFLSFALLLLVKGVPSGNGATIGYMSETCVTTFGVVVRYYFKR